MTTTQATFPEIEIAPKVDCSMMHISLDLLPPDHCLVGPSPSRQFVDSVSRFGVIHPITVSANDKGGYVVQGGGRRIKAARAAGMQTIEAKVYPSSKVFREAAGVAENHLRSENFASDLHHIEHLQGLGLPSDQICLITGLTRSQYDRRLGLTLLILPIRELFDQGKINGSIAERVAKLSMDRQAELLKIATDRGCGITAALLKEFLRVERSGQVDKLPPSLFGDDRPSGFVTIKSEDISRIADTLEFHPQDSDAFTEALAELRSLAKNQ